MVVGVKGLRRGIASGWVLQDGIGLGLGGYSVII